MIMSNSKITIHLTIYNDFESKIHNLWQKINTAKNEPVYGMTEAVFNLIRHALQHIP